MSGQSDEARSKVTNVYNAAADHFDDTPLAFCKKAPSVQLKRPAPTVSSG